MVKLLCQYHTISVNYCVIICFISIPLKLKEHIGLIYFKLIFVWLVGWLCLTSHRQRGHLETAPPFTVPCERREAR